MFVLFVAINHKINSATDGDFSGTVIIVALVFSSISSFRYFVISSFRHFAISCFKHAHGSFLSGFLLDENSDKLSPCHYSQQVAHQAKTDCAADVRTTSSVISYRLVLVKKKPNNNKLCLFQSSGCFTRFRKTQKNNYLTQSSSVQSEANIHWLLCKAKNFDCFTETPNCQT